MTDYLLPDKTFHELPMIYDRVGMSDYAQYAGERYVRYLQENGWTGRYVLELGCGTGVATDYLCSIRMNVVAIDSSEGMIEKTKERVAGKGYNLEVHLDDMRALETTQQFDLALSINTLSHIASVRHLSTVFQRVNVALKMGRLFMFDLWSIRGLVTQFGDSTKILWDDDEIFLAQENKMVYDAYRLHQTYNFFVNQPDGSIYRGREEHIMRGYPLSAISSMLARAGFEMRQTLDSEMHPFEEHADPDGRMVILAEKTKELGG